MAREQLAQAAKNFESLLQNMQENRANRSKLLAQQNENESVEQELQVLQDGCVLYKVMGPVLVRQSHTEAKNTVAKRLEYIRSEIERCDKIEKDVSNKINETATQIEQLRKKLGEGEQQQRMPRS